MSTAAGAEHLDWLHLVTLLLAFTMLCGLWWVYFAFGPATVQAALEESENRIELIRPVLSYGHLSLIAGIVAIAAGIGQAVANPAEPLPLDIAFTRWRLFQTLAVPRLSAATGILVLFLLTTQVAAVYSVTLLAVALIILNMVESVVLPRTLRRPGPAQS